MKHLFMSVKGQRLRSVASRWDWWQRPSLPATVWHARRAKPRPTWTCSRAKPGPYRP